MKNTTKNVVRLAGLAVGVAAAAWALRDRLLPGPEIHDEPPPKFREPSTESSAASDDLTVVKGIGPVTAEHLTDAGVSSIEDLASADPSALAETLGKSETAVAKWVQAAADLS